MSRLLYAPVIRPTAVSRKTRGGNKGKKDASAVAQKTDADHRRKGRPPKPDRPSASEKKFPCDFCQKRYGTKQSLQV